MDLVAIPGLYSPSDEDRDILKNASVCILTPCKDWYCAAKFAKSVANMISYSWMHGLKVFQMGITERMVVDWARNELARVAKEKINEYTGEKFTHLLWLDDDHTFPPDLALRLISHDKDMVSALYFGRTHPHFPVVYVKDTNDKYKHFPLIEAPGCLFECDAVGFGSLMMRRDVFDRVPEPWFTLDWKAGEDIAFCVKAKEHKIGVWCDGAYKLGHIGVPPVVTEADWTKAKKDDPQRFADKIRIELGESKNG